MIRKIILGIVFCMMSLPVFASPVNAADFPNPCTDYKIDTNGDGRFDANDDCPVSDAAPIEDDVRTGINIFLTLVGVLSVTMIIWGAVHITSSGGNPDRVKFGRNTVMFSILGLLLALLAAFIVNVMVDVANHL
ncbi:MAG: hypothetical protein LBC95_02125 [Candidatus Nomurabacteria bacterium]|jgi:hypothetical protein|nr:hypothetical protein [Candidatus Nomurabacteria bacterium]